MVYSRNNFKYIKLKDFDYTWCMGGLPGKGIASWNLKKNGYHKNYFNQPNKNINREPSKDFTNDWNYFSVVIQIEV